VLGLGCWIYDLRKERDELLGVEWLYRGIRSLWDDVIGNFASSEIGIVKSPV